jgi:hypothetical protein
MFNLLLNIAISWSQVRKDHLTLCKLLEEFETFLSPLIFTSYSVNIFFICLEVSRLSNAFVYDPLIIQLTRYVTKLSTVVSTTL